MDLQEAFDQGFEAVRDFVDDALAAFEKRLEALEARQPEKGDPGRDGKDADPEVMAAMVSEAVEKAIAAIPAPQDGKDGRDGLDAVTPLLKDGVLFFTMSDGTVKEVGKVAGENGKDGRDGFSLDDFDATLMEDGRTVLLSFGQGDTAFKVELGIPAMIYRGVYKEGQEYERGDTVTWGGSLWHCDVDKTVEKPDSVQRHWTLAAKKGRDGKAGKDGVLKEQKPVKVER